MSEIRYEVAPRSKVAIAALTTQLREMFGLNDPKLPVALLLEGYLPAALQNRYTFSVRDHREMGQRHGYVDPSTGELALREDVYDGICMGRGRDRFTACHEVGHFIMHGAGALNRVRDGQKVQIFRCPEWQANEFASALLMPERMVRDCRLISEVVERFGVSFDAADVRVRKLSMTLPP
ncbi:ImmA/IrrE family metallo-endopeptidase [Methylorubrum extorquens]|uniref:ImmA/IrrE family metallo-endopeptidase n=1 Tax=Methylorubrum extorquens TaxID=408 RepID=UPI002237A86D|nr:ImmA/IrrE family metallo-endopeptidase [Methylorubrum extorquens]UYW25891.1 ImmA/IrrE family metallo-endopeptidase [Methylorubrum extorquens]